MGNNGVFFDPVTKEVQLKAPGSGADHVIYTEARLEVDVNPTGYASAELACASNTFVATGYLERGYTVPTVGATLYTTAEGSTGFGTSCPNYVKLRIGIQTWACQIANGAGGGGEPCENPAGLIRTVVAC